MDREETLAYKQRVEGLIYKKSEDFGRNFEGPRGR
tara:strand:- start:1696 stop:1800 length:105 start_codon:yes stop_codon:yes gene_type:complete